jgi:hypothetical protein
MKQCFAGLIVALLLAGCGGSRQSNAQQVRGVISHFAADVGRNDWTAACSLVTGQIKTICREIKAAGPNSFGAKLLSSFSGMTISKVVVHGSAATVAFTGSSQVLKLTKQKGHWLITNG